MKGCTAVLSVAWVASAVTFLPALAAAHEATSNPGEPLPWTDADFRNDPDDFQFAIVTDRTGGARMGVFQDGLRKVNLLQPEFVMSVGDLIEGYTEDEDRINSEWGEFERFLHLLEMRFYFVPGNHDITNQVMAADWDRRFGSSYYHFVYKEVLFLCLNTEDEKPKTIGEEQVLYATSVLRDHPDVRWTLLFLHRPLWLYDNPSGWASIEEELKSRQHTVFAGHFHQYAKYHRNNQSYIVLATTGGGSSLAGPAFGAFDHFVWVTMSDQGPRLGNLLLDGVLDADVRTAESATLTDPFISGSAVGLAPIFVDGTDFTPSSTHLILTNAADIPLTFSGRFDAHESLRIKPVAVESEVGPDEALKFEIRVTPFENTSVDSLSPISLRWTAAYDSVEMHHSSDLVLQRFHDLQRREDPVRIDGVLDEWESLPFTNSDGHGEGPEDVSFKFAVVYDDDHLYVAVDVVDDDVLAELIPNPWYQDCIMVLIDARKEPIRSISRGRDATEVMAHLTLSPTSDPEVNVRWLETDLVNWAATHARLTDAGFAAEFALPINYLKERQGESWSEIRLNVGVQDHDSDGSSTSVSWMPFWNHRGDVAGSGTFRRR